MIEPEIDPERRVVEVGVEASIPDKLFFRIGEVADLQSRMAIGVYGADRHVCRCRCRLSSTVSLRQATDGRRASNAAPTGLLDG